MEHKIFFIADLHFNDKNILVYENRPFENVSDMNKSLIYNWNQLVTEEDAVYIIGDIGNVNTGYLKDFSVLRGKKYLIKGNHDTLINEEYRQLGFTEVYDKPILFENFFILSHEPIYMNQSMPYVNKFGHVHNNPIYKTCGSHHYCVSVERINYQPISFDEIVNAIKAFN